MSNDNFVTNLPTGVSQSAGSHVGTANTSDLAIVLQFLSGARVSQYTVALRAIKTFASAENVTLKGTGPIWIASCDDAWNYVVNGKWGKKALKEASTWDELVARARDYCERYQDRF